jgi:hypothetical protein
MLNSTRVWCEIFGSGAMDINSDIALSDQSSQDRYKYQFFKTTLCKYHFEGSCKKGQLCSHAHAMDELQVKPVLSKTRMCKKILRSGNCNDAQCTFAHDIGELVSANTFFRTKMCDFHLNGGCKLGDKCRYAHSMQELNRCDPVPSPVVVPSSIPPVDFNDSPDTGYPMRKRGSLSSRATMVSSSASSYASFASFAHFQDNTSPVVFVYPHPAIIAATCHRIDDEAYED